MPPNALKHVYDLSIFYVYINVYINYYSDCMYIVILCSKEIFIIKVTLSSC